MSGDTQRRVLIVFELTGGYVIILPLMAAVPLATGLSHPLSLERVYTLRLRRRRMDIDAESRTDRTLGRLQVRDAIHPVPADIDGE